MKKIKLELINFYNTEVREFFYHNLFEKLCINFSVRFMQKLMDNCINFPGRWKQCSIDYQRLSRAYQLIAPSKSNNEDFLSNYELPSVEEDRATSVKKAKEMGWIKRDGKWYKPRISK